MQIRTKRTALSYRTHDEHIKKPLLIEVSKKQGLIRKLYVLCIY
jgi:hypothetical protein